MDYTKDGLAKGSGKLFEGTIINQLSLTKKCYFGRKVVMKALEEVVLVLTLISTASKVRQNKSKWPPNGDSYLFNVSVFLDSSMHLYKKLCPSVCPHNAKIAENKENLIK